MAYERRLTWGGLVSRKEFGRELPADGAKHGSLAMVRRGCACEKCMDKRARMRRRGMKGI